MISISTCWLNLSATLTLATLSGCGAAHVLHTLQVSTMGGMSSNRSFGAPAWESRRCICSMDACHHRTCNLRSTRCRPPVSDRRRALNDRLISNSDQSAGRSSRHSFFSRSRGTLPRPPEGELGSWSEETFTLSSASASALASRK